MIVVQCTQHVGDEGEHGAGRYQTAGILTHGGWYNATHFLSLVNLLLALLSTLLKGTASELCRPDWSSEAPDAACEEALMEVD